MGSSKLVQMDYVLSNPRRTRCNTNCTRILFSTERKREKRANNEMQAYVTVREIDVLVAHKREKRANNEMQAYVTVREIDVLVAHKVLDSTKRLKSMGVPLGEVFVKRTKLEENRVA
ncbi:hypothetical protein Gotur_029739 [Gossypium turneri]